MARGQAHHISPEVDALSCELIGEALDQLAEGPLVGAVASVLDAQNMRLTCAFEDDSSDECLEAARAWVKNLDRGTTTEPDFGRPVCYALAYMGAVDAGAGYQDALVVEFGDKGADVNFSAFLLIEGVGTGDNLTWSEPAPAGELEPLI